MLQTYPGRGNPVLDALEGTISLRQLRVMVEHLPPDNPVQREVNGNGWTEIHWLLHSIDSRQRELNVSYVNAHKGKGQQPSQPTYLPTPNQAPAANVDTRTPEQIQAERAHFEAVLNRPNPH